MNLSQWAMKWGVPWEALEDLRQQMGMPTDPKAVAVAATEGLTESAVSAAVRREATRGGGRLWRNNVGVAINEDTGAPVRFGLANDSKQLNKVCKSSDLIGLRPLLIEPFMVGQVVGVFVARETKEQDWKFKGTEREKAQLAFLNLVIKLGGDAAFCTGEGTL